MDEIGSANLRAALALVTAWLEEPLGDNEFPTYLMIQLIEELGSGDVEGLVSLLTGTATLCGHLLERLAGQNGLTVQEMLGVIAVEYSPS